MPSFNLWCVVACLAIEDAVYPHETNDITSHFGSSASSNSYPFVDVFMINLLPGAISGVVPMMGG